MKLSDAYLEKTDAPMLELKVKVININLPANHKLLKQCRPLYEYSWFIQRIKDYMAKEMSLDKALKQTIEDCEKEGIMQIADEVEEAPDLVEKICSAIEDCDTNADADKIYERLQRLL